ncbi:MAG: rhomboid family intramembrane serine protease [Lachnospiraceae bacterium]|nr:rhomboid family intramembrane serine protease [Lachnospiraceae bacterium]
MEKLLNNLERKIGKYAIRNLSLYIIIAYAIGYVLALTGSVDFISLDPYFIMQGQVWRIITWILVPPSAFSILTIIMLYFYYQIGMALERTWGTFRYNIYIFSGIIFTIIGALALYFISIAGSGSDPDAARSVGYAISQGFSTYYINLSIFLAFAATYPNVQVLLFFVIPVRMKWMAYVYVAINAYQFVISGAAGRIAIVMSLLNFIVFFFATRNYKKVSFKEMYRKREYRNATAAASARAGNDAITKHKCAICGRTEKDGDDLEFRFCSKCNGNYEYCNEHLFTHKHIV